MFQYFRKIRPSHPLKIEDLAIVGSEPTMEGVVDPRRECVHQCSLTAEQSEQADLAGQVEVHDEVLDELRDEEKTDLGRILHGT